MVIPMKSVLVAALCCCLFVPAAGFALDDEAVVGEDPCQKVELCKIAWEISFQCMATLPLIPSEIDRLSAGNYCTEILVNSGCLDIISLKLECLGTRI